MMMNLFSIFDPSTSNYLSMNWISMFLFLFLLPRPYWSLNSRISMIMKIFLNFMVFNIKSNIKKSLLGSVIILLSLLSTICLTNLMGIFPFIFTPTTHLSISLALSIPLWISLMMKSWIESYNKMFAHLVPMNSPMILSPFMVIIETISIIIRPMTLAIRLSANMIAGHILISLMSSLLNSNLLIFYTSFLILNLLMLLEMAVAIIQSYVFMTLMSLYLNET